MGASWGHAHQWPGAAAGKGYTVDTTPAKGAIAYWTAANDRHAGFGHVAYVEDYLSASNTVLTSDYNNAGTGVFDTHSYNTSQNASSSNDKPDGYIHIERGSAKITGTWLAGTPSDLSFLMPGSTFNMQVRGTDSIIDGSGGIQKINITSYTPSPGHGWGIVRTTTYSGNPMTAEANAVGIMSNTPYILVSFDVYGKSAYKKAPGGVRKYCNPLVTTTCAHVAGEGEESGPGQGGGSCTTAPETASNVTGITPGNNGWWRSATTVTLSANAPCGGAGPETFYSINGGGQNTYGGPITLNQEGIYTVSYYSVDALGNRESNKTVVVKIDWTPPVTAGTATGPRDTNGIFRDNVTVSLNGTDNLSGVESNQYSRDGTTWTTLNGNNNTFVISGNGVFRANYRSQDVAGNLEAAKDSGPIIINKYVVFSNATGQSLRLLYGTTVNISGDMHSNGTARIYGNTGSVMGTTLRTVSSPNSISGNTNTTLPAITTGVGSVPMLSYPLSLYKSLATVVYPTNATIDSVGATMRDIIYVEGDAYISSVNLSGPLSIIATGNIYDYTTDSTFQTNDPHNGVLLYAGKDVYLSSTGNRNMGLVYAPNGTVRVDATNLTLKGSLVGSQVELNGATTFNLSYSAAFASSTHNLPLVAMGLVAGTPTTPPPLPNTPTLIKPVGGITVSPRRVAFSCSASGSPFGYHMQISTSSAFSTTVYDMGNSYCGGKFNLSPNTTYYWRARTFNSAGVLSNWSTVATFRTSSS